jgi:hypothetical protein
VTEPAIARQSASGEGDRHRSMDGHGAAAYPSQLSLLVQNLKVAPDCYGGYTESRTEVACLDDPGVCQLAQDVSAA